MADQTVINRRLLAWCSIEFSLLRTTPEGAPAAEEIITPIVALNYDDGANPTPQMGAGDLPHGVSEGSYEPGSMSFSCYTRYARDLMRRATNNGAVPLSSVDFRMVLKMRERGSDDILVDQVDFRIAKAKDDRKPGPDGLLTVFDCVPTLILRSGVRI